MEQLAELTKKLYSASVAHAINPYTTFLPKFTPKSELNPRQWFMPPEIISIHGTPAWEEMTEEEQMRLSFYELINLFSSALNGEKAQSQGLVSRLYSPELSPVTPYLHHFLDEENKHMAYFGEFCMHYAGKIYPANPAIYEAPKRAFLPGEDHFLFFAMLMIFEEIDDPFNVAIATDTRIWPLVREINAAHHKDEMRHLVFGREIVKALWNKHSPSWGPAKVEELRVYLNDYIVQCWWEYYNLKAYKDAGMKGDLFTMRDEAFEHPAARARRKKMTSVLSKFLLESGIFETEPDVG